MRLAAFAPFILSGFAPFCLPLDAATLSLNPNEVQVTLPMGGAGSADVIVTLSGATSAGISISVSTQSRGTWLSVDRTSFTVGASPATFNLTVNAATLTPGSYQGTITVNCVSGATCPAATVDVTAIVPGPPVGGGGTGLTLSVSPSTLEIWAANVTVKKPVSVSLPQVRATGSGSANLTVSTSTTTNRGDWLSATLSSPTITAGGNPVSVTVNADAGRVNGLSPGSEDTLTGQVTITATPGNSVVITVTLNIYSGADVTLSPAQPQFSVVPGQKLSQTVNATLASGALDQGFAITYIPSSPWLSAANLTVGAGVNVTVDGTGLASGTYSASIKLQSTAGGTPLVGVVYVRATVTGPAIISPAQTSLSFPLSAGSAASQKTVNIVATTDPAFFTSSVTAGANWLQAQSNSTATPAVLTVTATPGSLAPGNYTGNIRITPANGTAVSDIAVTMTITGAMSNLSVVSAASGDARVSSGMIAAVFGTGLSSATTIATSQVTTLSGVSVAVRDSGGATRACQIFFVSPGQINLAIPDATAPGSATLTVSGPSGVVASTAVQIAAVAPGIFTMDARPSGPAAALAYFYDAAGQLLSQPDAFRCTPAGCTTFPLDVNGGPQLVLSLYGTGFHRGTTFTARIGATSLTVLGVAALPQFPGEDLMNVLIPKSLAGAGDVALVITADGIASNGPHINLR
jgi:uncharacterized protein (TIGR03437 family)